MSRAWILAGLLMASCRREPVEMPESPPAAAEPGWRSLAGAWQGVMGGEVREADGVLRLDRSEEMTAARWTGEVPDPGFELECEARRVDGTDFFFALTFPVRTPQEHVTLVVGGWGGWVVGISSIDGMDASENETTSGRPFEAGRWYAIRLRSEPGHLRAWIDGEPVVDFATDGRELSLRSGPIDACLPFGLATWETTAEIRGLRWRPIEAANP